MSAAAPARSAAVPIAAPGIGSRVFGLGSVFGKTFRDSRRTALALGIVTALIVLVTAYRRVKGVEASTGYGLPGR